MQVYVYINEIYTLMYIKLLYSRKIPVFIPECDLFEKTNGLLHAEQSYSTEDEKCLGE